MGKKKVAKLKRRTREHVLADLSIHHVEGFVLQEGYTVQRIDGDSGYDLFVTTFDEKGRAERGVVFVQVKASESHQIVGPDWVFDLDIRDYNLWIREEMPVILVLFDAARQRAVWLAVQQYFRAVSNRPRRGAITIRVRVPSARRLRPPMKRAEITYGQLDRVLRSLGFTRRLVEKDPPAVRYEHRESGALISVPPFNDDDKALDHHLAVARATLETFGIADPFAFAAELQKAG